jgi:hypothetical protein
MALSMDEQRILEGMEQKLADDDPKLASRLAAFGQPQFPPMLGSGRARAALVLVSLALAAMVTLMVYAMRPMPSSQDRPVSPAQRTKVVPGSASQSTGTSQATGSSIASRPATPHA